MANQRAPGQKLLTIPASEDFIAVIDENLFKAGYSNRSQFIRDAILEKLGRVGIPLPAGLHLPVQRAGVGPHLRGNPPSEKLNSSKPSAESKRVADKLRRKNKPDSE